MASRFVSRAVVQGDGNEEVSIAPTGEAPQDAILPQKVQEYDPRTLYERLKANRDAKEEEFAEKTKLSNLIRKLDADDVNFIEKLREEREREREERDRLVKEELSAYRKAVQEASVAPQAAVVLPGIATKLPPPPKPAKGASTGKKPVVSLLAGAVVVKRKRDDVDVETLAEGAKKEKVTMNESTPDVKGGASKPSTTSQGPKPAGLGLVSTYGSDDDSS